LSKIRHHGESPEELLNRVYAWFNDHVVHEDLKIAEFFRNSPNRPIGEDLYAQFLGSPSSGAGD
jgi:hemerythrin